MLKSQFMKSFAFLTYFFATFNLRFSEFIKIRLFGRHKIFEVEKLNEEIFVRNQIAIIAIYPRKALLRSVQRLISILRSNNFAILVVLNTNNDLDIYVKALENSCTLLIRPNLGRDFGAYQLGVNWLRKNGRLDEISILVLANDSMLYHEKSTKAIEDVLKCVGPWRSLFVNFQFQVHAQSFFLLFDNRILKLHEFRNFWKTFYPTSIRHRVIQSGEMQLSKLLLSKGYFPNFIANAHNIVRALGSGGLKLEELVPLWSTSSLGNNELNLLSKHQHVNRIAISADTENPTHHLGLISARLLGCPIKLDLLISGVTSRMYLRDFMHTLGLKLSEVDEVLTLISARGTIATQINLQKLWAQFGLYK